MKQRIRWRQREESAIMLRFLAAVGMMMLTTTAVAVVDAAAFSPSSMRRNGISRPAGCTKKLTLSIRNNDRPRRMILFYKSDGRKDDNDNRQGPRQNVRPSISVLGPLVNVPPLIPGSKLILKDPTPMQWQSLEKALQQHEQHLQQGDTKSTTGITAAPLIAIVMPNDPKTTTTNLKGRYATIAAILGVSNERTKNMVVSFEDDNSSFMERFRSLNSEDGGQTRSTLNIHLLGIGRAVLTDFFYITAHDDDNDEEDEIKTTATKELTIAQQEDLRHEQDVTNAIVQAHFRPLTDTTTAPQFGRRGRRLPLKTALTIKKNYGSEFGGHSSPVHALAKLSQIAMTLHLLHEQRKQLVAQLQAGYSRLEYLQQQRKTDNKLGHQEENLLLMDHDGIGQLFGFDEDDKNDDGDLKADDDQPTIIDELLQKHPPSSASSVSSLSKQDVSTSSSPYRTDNNFGLGYSTLAAVSTFSQLANMQLKLLRDYYSPEICDSEHFQYELYSFTVLSSVFPTNNMPNDVALWALQCTHTKTRLDALEMYLRHHVDALEQMATDLANDLRTCGDECTDLFPE